MLHLKLLIIIIIFLDCKLYGLNIFDFNPKKLQLYNTNQNRIRFNLQDSISNCDLIAWPTWVSVSPFKFIGNSKFGQIATIELDSLTMTPVPLFSLELFSPTLKPKIIPAMPSPFFPGAPVVTLRHKIKFNINNVQDIIFYISSVTNSKKDNTTLQHTKITAYDAISNKLDVSNVKLLCHDPTIFNLPNTQVIISATEIDLSVDDAFNLGEGDALFFSNLPVNTSYLIVEHNDDKSYIWDSVYLNVGLPDYSSVSPCTQTCKKTDWAVWNNIIKNKFSGKTKRGKYTLEFDQQTGSINTGLFNLNLASNTFTPKIITNVPTPFMPGIAGVTTLIHKLNLDSINDPSELFLLLGEFPNAQNPIFSIPQIGKLRVFNSTGIQLNLPNVCEVLQDPLSSMIFSPTEVRNNINEILFSVDHPGGADGGIIILTGFPKNASYFEIEHFDELSSQWDGIYINVGLPDCCSVFNLVHNVTSCIGDSNHYSFNGSIDLIQPLPTGNLILLIDNKQVQTLLPPHQDKIFINFNDLIADGKTHTFSFYFSDAPDCIITISFQAPSIPDPPNISVNSFVCENDSIQLGVDLGINFKWTGPNNFSSNIQNPIIPNANINHEGRYTVIITDSNGCTSSAVIDIKINKKTFSTLNYTACDTLLMNGVIYDQSGIYSQVLKNTVNCDSIITLNATILKSSTSHIKINTCDSIIFNKVKYTSSGNYQLTLINSAGCDSVINLELIINGHTATLDAGKDTSICEGEKVNLQGLYSGSADYLWQSTKGTFDNPFDLNTNYFPNTPGDHTVYLNSSDSCDQHSDSLVVCVLPQQIIKVTGDSIIDPCKEITFTATGGTNYIWTPSSLIECIDPACKTIKLKTPGSFTFSISSDGTCVIPATLNLSLLKIQSDLFVPNVFSPNGDNINDFFLPYVNCEHLEYYHLQIFDRWGNLVFETFERESSWDGNFNDEKMNPAVFTYAIEYQFPASARKIISGDVTLVR